MDASTWKLRVELVPQQMWGMSMSNRLKARVWRELRLGAIAKCADRCDACGIGPDERQEQSLHVHEMWSYDDQEGVQTLVKLRPLCATCSACVHIGRAGVVARSGGGIDVEELREHLAKVNERSRTEVDEHISDAFHQWRARSAVPNWRQDYGEWAAVMTTPGNLKGSRVVR
jgi:hypothetical protein